PALTRCPPGCFMSRKLDRSRDLQQRAERFMPGGVNSPVRAFRAVGGEPPVIVRGEGARMFDADGNAYLDYVLSWGPLMLGHCAPDLAEAVLDAFPSMEKLRFVSSGTEATMSAIRLARAYTNRKFILKFEGCYH